MVVTKKHVVRTSFDRAFLEEMEEAGEIRLTSHVPNPHVVGMEGFIRRAWAQQKRGKRNENLSGVWGSDTFWEAPSFLLRGMSAPSTP
jgi:hypothetical protein